MSSQHRGGWGDVNTGTPNPAICYFTKHHGRFWVEVLEDDRPYMEWLVGGEHDMELHEELYEHLIELLEE